VKPALEPIRDCRFLDQVDGELDGDPVRGFDSEDEAADYVYQGGRWRSSDCDFDGYDSSGADDD
jgi:hypothetical protein